MTACARCQAALAPGHRFCGACGTAVPDGCPSCQSPLRPGDRFCRTCGADATAGRPPLAQARSPAARGRQAPVLPPSRLPPPRPAGAPGAMQPAPRHSFSPGMMAATITSLAWLIAMGVARSLGRKGGALVSGGHGSDVVLMIVVGGALAIGLGLAAFALVRRRERRMQALRDADAATLVDDLLGSLDAGQLVRPYFVYLRSFSTTGRLRVTNPGGSTWVPGRSADGPILDLEVALGRALEARGDLVALGEPGEQIGAGRIPSDEGSWQRTVTLLVDHARGVLVVPSDGAGTLWEIGRLRQAPPWRRRSEPADHASRDFDLADVWRRATAAVSVYRPRLPPYDPAGLLFTIGRDGHVRASQSVRFHQEGKVRAAVEALLDAAAA